MSPAAIAPRDHLDVPSQFGVIPDAKWRFPSSEDWHDAKIATAYYQHYVACRARARIIEEFETYSPSKFAEKFHLGDVSGITKKLDGHRPGSLTDYLLWAYHLGRTILPDSRRGDYADREDIFVPVGLRLQAGGRAGEPR